MSTGRSEAQQSMGCVIILYICIHACMYISVHLCTYLYICIHACMYISVHLYTVYTYLYIVVAVPRKDNMSPARANAAPVWALQLICWISM